MNWPAVIVSVVVGLAINEYADFAPWIARKIVRRAAHRMYAGDAERAEIRAEEWAAIIDARPGKLFKLMSALGYGVAAVLTATHSRERLNVWARLAILHGLYLSTMEIQLLESLFALRMRTERARMAVAAVLFTPPVVSLLIVAVQVSISGVHSGSPLGIIFAAPMIIGVLIVNRLYLMCAVVVTAFAILPGGWRQRQRALAHGRSATKRDYFQIFGLESRVRKCATCRSRGSECRQPTRSP